MAPAGGLVYSAAVNVSRLNLAVNATEWAAQLSFDTPPNLQLAEWVSSKNLPEGRDLG